MKHQVFPERCPCRDPTLINVAVDPVLEVAGHRFKIPTGTWSVGQMVRFLDPDASPIGIDFRARRVPGNPSGALHVNTVRHKHMLQIEMKNAAKAYAETIAKEDEYDVHE